MPKYYNGVKGSYEIYDQSSIILRKLDNNRLSGESEVYRSIDSIPQRQDRWRIQQIVAGSLVS